jgi:hypothetical protein
LKAFRWSSVPHKGYAGVLGERAGLGEVEGAGEVGVDPFDGGTIQRLLRLGAVVEADHRDPHRRALQESPG